MSGPVIKTLRMFLEPVTPAHAPKMFAGLADERGYRFLPEEPPESVDKLRAKYEILTAETSPDGKEIWLNWMLKRRGGEHYVGYVQATIIKAEKAALIAYHIFPQYWGQQLGREAVKGMLNAIATEYRIREARAYVDTRNLASIRLVEALGFQLAATVVAPDDYRGESHEEHLFVLKMDS